METVKSPHAAFRRATLKRIRDLSYTLGFARDHWKVASDVYDGNQYADESLPGGRRNSRPRTLLEYPENDPALIRSEAYALRDLAHDLVSLAIQLDKHAAEVKIWRDALDPSDPRLVRQEPLPRS